VHEARDDVVERGADTLEQRGDVAEDLRGLGGDAAVDELVIRVEPALPGQEDEAASRP
jgi:hypothetical protein